MPEKATTPSPTSIPRGRKSPTRNFGHGVRASAGTKTFTVTVALFPDSTSVMVTRAGPADIPVTMPAAFIDTVWSGLLH